MCEKEGKESSLEEEEGTIMVMGLTTLPSLLKSH